MKSSQSNVKHYYAIEVKPQYHLGGREEAQRRRVRFVYSARESSTEGGYSCCLRATPCFQIELLWHVFSASTGTMARKEPTEQRSVV